MTSRRSVTLASFGKGSTPASISPPFLVSPSPSCRPVWMKSMMINDFDTKAEDDDEDYLKTASPPLKLLNKPL